MLLLNSSSVTFLSAISLSAITGFLSFSASTAGAAPRPSCTARSLANITKSYWLLTISMQSSTVIRAIIFIYILKLEGVFIDL